MGEAQPGWYDSGDGKQRWYDGTRWTDKYRTSPTPPPPDYDPKMDAAAAPKLQPEKKGRGSFLGCIGCLGLVIVAVVAVQVWGSTRPESPYKNKYEAIAQCEARIEGLLKSPATADFSTDATGAGANWTVTGTVDSENGFGAMLRSEFQCSVTVNEDTATTKVNYLN